MEEKMEVLKTEDTLCLCCMERHPVHIVRIREKTVLDDIILEFDAEYLYCSRTETLWEDKERLCKSYKSVKMTYRKKTETSA